MGHFEFLVTVNCLDPGLVQMFVTSDALVVGLVIFAILHSLSPNLGACLRLADAKAPRLYGFPAW
jgi:hypothetical protein